MAFNAPSVAVERWRDGSAFRVKAHPGARRDGVSGCHDGMLKIEVTAAPEKGKANKALTRFLAARLEMPGNSVELLSGETSAQKRFGVRGVEPEELAEKIKRLLK